MAPTGLHDFGTDSGQSVVNQIARIFLVTGRRLADLNPEAVIRFVSLPGVGLPPQLESPGVMVGLMGQMLELINNFSNKVSHSQN